MSCWLANPQDQPGACGQSAAGVTAGGGADCRPLLDTLHFFDNSSDTARLIFKDQAGQTTVNDHALHKALRQQFAP